MSNDCDSTDEFLPIKAAGRAAGHAGRARTKKKSALYANGAPPACHEPAGAGAKAPADGAAARGATTMAGPEGAQTRAQNSGDMVVGWSAAAEVAGRPETSLRRLGPGRTWRLRRGRTERTASGKPTW